MSGERRETRVQMKEGVREKGKRKRREDVYAHTDLSFGLQLLTHIHTNTLNELTSLQRCDLVRGRKSRGNKGRNNEREE